MTHLRLLGAVELRGETGECIDLGPQQQRCVLAVLALSPGRAVAVETVITNVWGPRPPGSVRDLVYKYVSRLRRLLRQTGASVVLHRSAGGYVLDLRPDEVDVHRARTLVGRARQERAQAVELFREATGLWRGTPLADLRGDWAARARAGLVRERITLLTERFDAELERGRHAEIVMELSGAVAEHPSAEPLIAQFMLALYRTGRPADAQAAYDTFRRYLVEELGQDPGRALRELHQRILRHDPGLHDRPACTPPSSHLAPVPVVVRPAQLPPDVAGFVGRDDYLVRLDPLLPGATGTAAVCAIVGTAGIGKTTLAVHWAHQAAGHFPDGQLYVNLRGFDDTHAALAPAQVLRGFLAALGLRKEQFPRSTEALSALFRRVLAGRRVLLILDNARDLDQVRSLLPVAPGCLTLITSRSEPPGLLTAGATRLGLELFTPGEARQMLVHRLGASRLDGRSEAVEEIVERCAGLPLALAVVAAIAAAHPAVPLGTLAEQLREEDRGLAPVFTDSGMNPDIRAVFSWSYRGLSPAAARLFRLTGLPAGPDLSCAAAAHLTGFPPRRTRTLLSELTRAHLLTERAPGRFTSHDLLRAYATELTHRLDPEPERQAALSRLLDYYLHSAHAACLATGIHLYLEPPGPPLPTTTPERFTDATRAMDWFAAEHRTLTAAVRLAARTGFDGYATQLSRWLTTFLDRQGYWHEQEELQHTALQAALRLDEPVEQARSLSDLARAHIRAKHFEQALARLKKALDLFHACGDTRGQTRVHHLLSYVQELRGEYDEALDHSLRMLDLERSAGDQDGLGRALNSVGWLHTLRGDHEQALSHLGEALALQERIGDQYGVGMTLDSLALAHQKRGDWPRAIAYYQQALDLLQSPVAANRLMAAHTLARLGDTRHSAGDPAGAHDAWRRALGIYEELQHPRAEDLRARLDGMSTGAHR